MKNVTILCIVHSTGEIQQGKACAIFENVGSALHITDILLRIWFGTANCDIFANINSILCV